MQHRNIIHSISDHAYAFGSGYCTSLSAASLLKNYNEENYQSAFTHFVNFAFITYGWYIPNVEQPRLSIRLCASAGFITGLWMSPSITSNGSNNNCTCLEEGLPNNTTLSS
jgi:hypothetical protein